MPDKIDPKNNELSIYNWHYAEVSLADLKLWVDTQIAKGNNSVRLGISWGYYNDLDGLELIAEKK